jgi:hypothetical protein
MISEVFCKAYDGTGRRLFRLNKHRHGSFSPNFPMRRHVSQPLTVTCNDLEEVRRFLQSCRYVSDEAQFGRDDYWIPPDEFERRRTGDCDDFALWTWRQLMSLGYSARFVCGSSGRYGEGHAWVTFQRDGRTFLMEPLAAPLGPTFPRLSTLRYEPRVSVTWDGEALKYFEHVQAGAQMSFVDVASHIPEWIGFWVRLHLMVCVSLLRRLHARATGHA